MKSKYINTFDTTAEYNNYIESAFPSFPNVGYDKEADKVNIVRTSPNDHVLYGEVVDPAQQIPTISLSGTVNTPTLDEINNAFYLDSWSNGAPTSISFGNESNIKSIKKLKGLDTSNVTNMYNMFYNCSSLTSLDLSNLDTSNVTNMYSMFQNCSSLTSLDLSNFNTSKVTSMNSMFYYCSKLISLDLSNFDTSKVTDMTGMFYYCSKLISLDLSSFNTSKVTDMTGMFLNCSSLKDVYITAEATLNKLTNNLTSQGYNYIPSSATIHYNGVDYKWTGSAWAQQN